MKSDLMLSATLLCLALARSLTAQAPHMHSVQPDTGKIGDVLRVQGVSLGAARVDEVYLSDHTFDLKVKVLEQSDDVIDFRIPPFAKPGKLQLVVKITGKQPLLLEQPLYITVKETTDLPRIADSRALPDIPVKQVSISTLPLSNAAAVEHPALSTRSKGPAQPGTGRLIWTGALPKNALLSFSADGASSGILNGRLPGDPVKITLHPAELVEGGIAVYSKERQRFGASEPPSAWNGWNVVVHDWDPRRITEVNVVQAPSPANDWKRLVLRNGSQNLSVLVVEWQRLEMQ